MITILKFQFLSPNNEGVIQQIYQIIAELSVKMEKGIPHHTEGISQNTELVVAYIQRIKEGEVALIHDQIILAITSCE